MSKKPFQPIERRNLLYAGAAGLAGVTGYASAGGSDDIELPENEPLVFRAQGPGAVERSVMERLSDTFSADDYRTVQHAIDAAALRPGLTMVSLSGRSHRVDGPLIVKPDVVLYNGEIVCDTLEPGEAIISMGSERGVWLTRVAGIQNVRVKTKSTTPTITGFRIDNYVRGGWIRDCVAEMNGDTEQARHHIGFEILATTIAGSDRAGTYQCEISGCLAMFATDGFSLDTRGPEAQTDPQANANWLFNNRAFSCRRRALYIGHGARENIVWMRADTWPKLKNPNAVVEVVRIEGRANQVHLFEEVGSVAQTQYTYVFGPTSQYNRIDFTTQQVVTAIGRHEAQGVSKNVARQHAQAMLKNFGGEPSLISYYTSDPIPKRADQLIRHKFISPRRCIVSKVTVRLDGQTSDFFDFQAAKNENFTKRNRIRFAKGEGLKSKSLLVDATAATIIDESWFLEEGDVLVFAFSNGNGEQNAAAVTVDLVWQ